MGGGLACSMSFLDPFAQTSLIVRRGGRASGSPGEIEGAWSSLLSTIYPGGAETIGLIALRIAQHAAHHWRFDSAKPVPNWVFVNDVIR
jgi:hypothetical protein